MGATQSALAELTSLECGGETSGSEVEGGADLAPHQPHSAWIMDGILWPLPSVAL